MGFFKGMGKYFSDIFKEVLIKVISWGLIAIIVLWAINTFVLSALPGF